MSRFSWQIEKKLSRMNHHMKSRENINEEMLRVPKHWEILGKDCNFH